MEETNFISLDRDYITTDDINWRFPLYYNKFFDDKIIFKYEVWNIKDDENDNKNYWRKELKEINEKRLDIYSWWRNKRYKKMYEKKIGKN